ncbi:glycoside hydrolase family 2 protein [Pseudonocardia sp. GCM10023141]|uniref:glycoside hydrolase family 2 protein n=1 Tax=Pseudonocardia sp. GCM10023141 TaxID=3252653 RepID=UPI00361445F6
MMRTAWADLDGTWSFRHDDEDTGLGAQWAAGLPDAQQIVVPFPPESTASGIADPRFHPVVWYARTITAHELAAAGRSEQAPVVLLHFGAVDHRARVWVDGRLAGEHEGGHTPFTFDITALVDGGPDGGSDQDGDHVLVVRAQDDPHDLTQPRGKQDWHEDPHAIWYRRTTGIWQTVWLEAVPATGIEHLQWLPAGPSDVELSVRFRGRAGGTRLRAVLRFDERDENPAEVAEVEVAVPAHATRVRVPVPLSQQRSGPAADELHWSPERPRLIDATVSLHDADGAAVDAVASYLGWRTVGVARGTFLLNGHPYDVRSVLQQGYWPESHLAAPSRAALRREVELIKELGFTACRIHQKIEDPRFLYWADRLGLLVWGEAPGAYEFSPVAVQRLTREWMEAVDRDVSHPSIVTWVPFNESWGIQQVADDPRQQAYSRALSDLTRALDPSRPVISNDGWEQPDSDIVTVHDYEGVGAVLARTYADEAARDRLLAGPGPAGRRILVDGVAYRGQPIMLTEFGGIDHQPAEQRADGWGYTSAADPQDWIARITALYDAIRASAFLAGSCYTQLTDTLQETNGLLTADREPKVPIAEIRRAVLGRGPAG